MKKPIELSMYEKLLHLPLFQGLGSSDMSWVIEKIKFDFSKYKAGDSIIQQDSSCNSLVFMLSGEVQMETWDINHQYAIYENIPTPTVLQPEVLFGPQTRYTHGFNALSDVGALIVSKEEFWRDLIQYEVFRLNYINLISAQAQYAKKLLWTNPQGSVEQRIVHFVYTHCTRPAGEKKLKIKMEILAEQLSETRDKISKALNNLQDKGLLVLKRSAIEIPHLETLITETR